MRRSPSSLRRLRASLSGKARPYRPRVRSYARTPPGRPANLALSIAAIADVHYGDPVLEPEHLQQIIDITNELNADLVVLVGDYGATHHTADEHQRSMTDFAQAAQHLHAPLGVYAVLGNHDWWSDPQAQAARRGPIVAARVLTDVGIRVMDNDAVRLTHHDRAFWLAGLGDQQAFPHDPVGGVDDLLATIDLLTDDAPAPCSLTTRTSSGPPRPASP